MKKLTPKQKAFADEYIKFGNATQAAIGAGYSAKTARSIGQENLTKPDISNYINERLKQIEDEKNYGYERSYATPISNSKS